MADSKDEIRPIIVKKVKKGGGGHHGGAWKVAYADFVTAMMAFFLLLWLLSVTTEVQKNGISDYFTSRPMVTRSEDGSGGVLGGLSISKEGAMITEVKPMTNKPEVDDPAMRAGSMPPREETNISDERFKEELRKREEENFKRAQAALENAIKASPELTEMASALKVDMTSEGLRIQIVDQEDKPLFASGSADLLNHTKELLRKVSDVIQKLPNEISVRGHTDSVPYGPGAKYTNWELSADRANASRRELLKAGLPAKRINNVVGKADTDHLFPDTPRDGKNRRISIILLHEAVTISEGANKSSRALERREQVKEELYRKTEGEIDFP